MNQKYIDNNNSQFWSEPCGTTAAMALNLDTSDKNHLEKFDSWYKSFYPYLFGYMNKIDFSNLSVLEIGIGYGTVSRYLSSRARDLTLLDIAPGALNFVKSSASFNERTEFICESIFEYTPKEKFDFIVAIGSLHHTGNLEMALNRAESFLKEGGNLLVMVYYAFQPRRVIMHPLQTLIELLATRKKLEERKVVFEELSAKMRGKADTNKSGESAPHTSFSSRRLFENRDEFSYTVKLENFHHIPIVSRLIGRAFFLKYFSRYFGCDIYALGSKDKSLS